MIEEVKKIKLLVIYFNNIVKEYKRTLHNLEFNNLAINFAIDDAIRNGYNPNIEEISIYNKIKDKEFLKDRYEEKNPIYVDGLSQEEVKEIITDLETDLAYLEYYSQNKTSNYYEDLIFRTKDIIDNLILNLTRYTLGNYYELLAPLLPNYDYNDYDKDWNVDNICDFLIKYDAIKRKQNKSMVRILVNN